MDYRPAPLAGRISLLNCLSLVSCPLQALFGMKVPRCIICRPGKRLTVQHLTSPPLWRKRAGCHWLGGSEWQGLDDGCSISGNPDAIADVGEAGVLAVEMQAASRFAFGAAQGVAVASVAMVSNAVDHEGEQFNTGTQHDGLRIIEGQPPRPSVQAHVGRGVVKFISDRSMSDESPPRSACKSSMTWCNEGEASLTASMMACSRGRATLFPRAPPRAENPAAWPPEAIV